jgi:hypothetical protein
MQSNPYGCGEKGHIVTNCPKNKKSDSKWKQGQPPTTAKGNAAQDTGQHTSHDNEIVCIACHIDLEEAKIAIPPCAGPQPLI